MSETASGWVFDPNLDRHLYVRRVLDRYRQTPTCAGRVRREDQRLAHRLFDQRIPLRLVEAALVLAAARRLYRDASNGPLSPIRSLHYILPLLDEILQHAIDPAYIHYVERKVRSAQRELENLRNLDQPSATKH